MTGDESASSRSVEHADPDAEGTRLDRELIELLQELRVILPGVQVLFAFLLAVPFSNRFRSTDDLQRTVFFVAFVATTLSSLLTIAPGVQHRLRWRRFDKERLLRNANRLALAGTFFLGVAIDAVAFLVTDFLYGAVAASVCAAAVAVAAVAVWWAWPFARELRRHA